MSAAQIQQMMTMQTLLKNVQGEKLSDRRGRREREKTNVLKLFFAGFERSEIEREEEGVKNPKFAGDGRRESLQKDERETYSN